MIDVDIEQELGAFRLACAFTADAPVVGLFGRSGAGKSSVVNAIAGIAKLKRGFIRVGDVALFDAAKGIDLAPDARRIGYVFQDALLFPPLDVESNLLAGQRLRPAAARFIDPARVIALLGLDALLRRAPRTLSGGEKQRVAIGRALLAQPRILLMDEPLASLDLPRKAEVLDYIERLRDEFRIPLVYVSHSIAEIARLADKVVVLADGKCVAVGNVDEVLGRTDLQAALARYEAGTVVDARVAAHDVESQLTTLAFAGGELIVPRLGASIGKRIRVRVRARDVSLAIKRPSEISILNVLAGKVAAIADHDAPAVDVTVGMGTTALVATITRRSFSQLGIHVGQELYALVKAVSFEHGDLDDA